MSETDIDSPGEMVPVIGLFEGGGRPIIGEAVSDWLLGEARAAPSTAALFDELCWRLVGTSIPLWRATIMLSTLHRRRAPMGTAGGASAA